MTAQPWAQSETVPELIFADNQGMVDTSKPVARFHHVADAALALAALDFIGCMARFTAPEDEFEALKAEHGVNPNGSVSDGDLGSFADVEEMVSEFSDERLCREYDTFMEMVREARKILG